MTKPVSRLWGPLSSFALPLFFSCSAATLHAADDDDHYLDRDVRDDVFYFVLPDRFHNGDRSNDTGGIEGGREQHGFDPEDKAYYHGGDLQGLAEKLPYLKGMGITAVWLTPIFKNDPVNNGSAGYHGYWTLDYTQIDPHLGGNESLQTLIDRAHDMNIKIFFDVVINHTADVIRYAECHNSDGSFPQGLSACSYRDSMQDAYTPFIPSGDENVKVPAWLNNMDHYNNRGDSTFAGESSILGDFFGLDDLDTTQPQVVEGMTELFMHWISEYKIDGFRVDTVKHVDMDFWKQWTPAIKAHAESEGIPNFFVFGEIYDGNPVNLSRYSTEGELSASLDFGLYYALKDVFANNHAPSRLNDIFALDDWYTDRDSDASFSMNFVSNHDVGRLAYEIRNANPGISDQDLLARLEQAYALIYFSRGIPVVYYGDEQGFVGGGSDQNAREDMFPSQVDEYNDLDLVGTDYSTGVNNFRRTHRLYRSLGLFARLLKQHDGLRRGQQMVRHASDEPGILAFSKIDQGLEYLVVLNTSTDSKNVSLEATADRYRKIYPTRDQVKTIDNSLQLSVQGLSVSIYMAADEHSAPDIESVNLVLDSSRKASGRTPIAADVSWVTSSVLPMTSVTFEVSVDGGEYQHAGTDHSPDYNLFFNADDYPQGSQLSFRARATDQSGNSLISEAVAVEVGVNPGLEVMFSKPADWGNDIKVYYWNAEPAPGVSWPGVEAESLGNGLYRYQFPDNVSAANLIFNDGNGQQTADLYRDSDGCFVDSGWQDRCESEPEPETGPLQVFFKKPAEWSSGINIYYWNADPADPVNWPGIPAESLGDDWYSFEFSDEVASANVIFNDGSGNQTADLFRDTSGCYVDSGWQDSCNTPEPGLELFFHKPEGWGEEISIYYWNADGAPTVNWPGTGMQTMADGWYRYEFPAGVTSANVIFTDGQGNQTADLFRDSGGCFESEGSSWSDNCDVSPLANVSGARAHWLSRDRIAWMTTGSDAVSYKLYSAAAANLEIANNQIVNADVEIDLSSGSSLSEATADKFRHLADWPAFALTLSDAEIAAALKGEIWAVALDSEGRVSEATRVQLPGVIDDLFSYSGKLGVDTDSGVTLRLWAPTAQQVALKIYDADFNLLSTEQAVDLSEGVYRFIGNSNWIDQYYRYEVTVFHPETGAVGTYEVTDPYSVSLSQDSQFSQIVDLSNDAEIKPLGWDSLQKPLPAHVNISVYEGHVRDFSISDPLVPEEHRGTYLAFTYNGQNGQPLSHGMSHLTALANAGLTHLHLLPVNDISSVKENPDDRVDLDDPYSRLCEKVATASVQAGCEAFADVTIREAFEMLKADDPTTDLIQAINYDQRTQGFPSVDGFNWGYDPYHFLAPEGSYATNTNGKQRVLELREMVRALNEVNLKLVVDVVFNHTSASGLWSNSVLDKVVPGYYHRLNALSGTVETSTCCDNTAAEHSMMEKLMVDSILLWAQHYKIDAFRFDLMGHHPKSVMENIRTQLNQLTLAQHGVDGSNIYLYGEGWDFGEVAGNQRFDQATQFNLAGTGIGTFNDRLRDAVRGGNFTDRGRAQGFTNGNGTFDNGVVDGASTPGDQADRIRIGLAGNLQDYPFVDNGGNLNTGLNYSGVGYNSDPQENVVYIDKHDNETLWDNTQAKLPDWIDTDSRVRVQSLGHAIVNFSQGIPFHQMGTDLLRSKSMDRDSFDSGDWFNKVDFTLEDNNWAVGLPSEDKNGDRWDVMRDILSNPNIDPVAEHLQAATAVFRDQLAIRYSSPLFRLDNAEQVKQRVGFWNTGSEQLPGLITMTISDGACSDGDFDPQYDGIAVIFNADDEARSVTLEALAGMPMSLHPVQAGGSDLTVQQASYDSANGTFEIPALTAAVFVQAQNGSQGEFPCNPSHGLVKEPGFTTYFKKPDHWTEVNIYYWNATPSAPAVNWPGVPMEDLGEGWYAFTFADEVTASNLIFNNNSGEQTGDLYREGDGCFDYTDSFWTDSCTLPGLKFWLEKPAHWSDNINLYFWGASVSGPGWPGEAMENLGDGWFFYQMPQGVRESNLIFNDADGSGEQTSDLFRSRNGCYSQDAGWVETCTLP